MSTIQVLVGLGFAALLAFIAVYTARLPLRNLRRLKSSEIMASDDRYYLRKQARLRLINSGLMIVLCGVLAGSYISGLEQRAFELGKKIDEHKLANLEIPEDEKEIDRTFAKLYSFYWSGILILIFLIVCVAVIDLFATRKYAWHQLTLLKNDHKARLERDLALYRSQAKDRRNRGGIRN